MPHIRFNWVDILFVTLLIRVSYIAFKNGFFPEFFRSIGLLSAFIISFNNYASLSNFLSTHAKWTGPRPDIISFLFIFLALLFIFKIVAVLARMFMGSSDLSMPNRVAGLVLGIGRAILLASLIFTLFFNGPFEYLSESTSDRSFSGRYVLQVAPSLYRACMNFYPAEKNDTPLVVMLESQ